MDKFGDYISVVLKGVCMSNVHREEIEEEIRDHLEMAKKELIEAGYTDEQAELQAIQRFGEVKDVKKRFKSVFTPYRRIKDIVNGKRLLKESIQWTICIVEALFISLLIRSYAFASTEVKQCSMQNTLFEGQRLIENKAEYYCSVPKRGDIIIINREAQKGIINTFIANTEEFFSGPSENEGNERKRLIKRVIGIPGDKINIRDGKLYLNGNCCNESYVKGATYPNNMKFPIAVPEKSYFVMGDNRENSMDSRNIGFIKIDEIEGKAVLRLWPLDEFGSISNY